MYSLRFRLVAAWVKAMDHQSDEPQTDFLQFLETNMSHQIMSFVDDPDDLVRASAVSRFWYHFGE